MITITIPLFALKCLCGKITYSEVVYKVAQWSADAESEVQQGSH